MRKHAHCNHFIANRHVAVPSQTMGFTSHDLHTLSIVKQRSSSNQAFARSLDVPVDYPGESGEPNGPMQIVKGAESEFCRRSAISSFPPRTRYQSRAQRQPRAWSTRDASGAASPRYLCSLMIFPARGQGTASTRRPRALKPPCGPKNAADCRLLPQPKSTVETLRSARLA